MSVTRVMIGAPEFEVTRVTPAQVDRVVLFAAGRGGDPQRHLPLLEALASVGCQVIAPHSDFFTDPRITADIVTERARRLRTAVASLGSAGLPVHGIGHSIGGTLLLALASAQLWLGPGQPLAIEPLVPPLESLTLFAPALGVFQAPQALTRVTARTTLWWGSADTFCPRAQVDAALAQLGAQGSLRIAEGAGHFSFMHAPPPNTVEPLPDRDAFLRDLTTAVCASLTR